MARSGGDEPEVELVEGARRWWPVWLIGAGLLAVAVIAALTGGGGGSGGGDPPTTTPETTLPPLDEGVGATTEPPSPLSTAPVPIATVSTSHLGLTGDLIAWAGTELHRLDLTSGEWVQLPPNLVRGDLFSTSLAASPTGFVAVADEGVVSFDLHGVELDRVPREGSMAQLHTQMGRLWLVDGLFEPGLPQIRRLDPDGMWVSQPASEGELFARTQAVIAGGAVYISPQAGGIYETGDGATRWVADGYAVAGGPNGLIRYHCPGSLDTCTYQELEVPSMAVVAELELPAPADRLVGPAAFSPDLRHWHDPWGGPTSSAARDVTSGEVVPLGALDDPEHWPGRGFWSPDSKWLVSFDRGTIRMVELATGRVLGIPAPDGVRDTMSPILLYRP